MRIGLLFGFWVGLLAAQTLRTISEIQILTPPDADNDTSPFVNDFVRIEDCVVSHSFDAINVISCQEINGGPWSGIVLDFNQNSLPPNITGADYTNFAVGTMLAVEGFVFEFLTDPLDLRTVTEIAVANVSVLGVTDPPTAQVITAFDFQTSNNLAEMWESVLIELNDATVEELQLFGEWTIVDDTGLIVADDLARATTTYRPSLTDNYEFIRGIGWYRFLNYQLEPRTDDDISVRPLPSPSDNSLSDGAIAGVVIAVVACFCLVIVAAVIVGAVFASKDKVTTVVEYVPEANITEDYEIDYKDLEIGNELGQGAFGTVYKGIYNGTEVAIKKIHAKFEDDPTHVQEFKHEAETIKKLRPHPNVVLFMGITSPPQPSSIITEFCNGGTLYQLIHRESVGDTKKVLLAHGIAKGVYHLHQHDVVHRDLAARNVLLNQGIPKIADFGMSRERGRQSEYNKTAAEVGPLKWMAPEALAESAYSSKSDVFSFAVTLWELVTQMNPWEGISAMNAALKVCNGSRLPLPPDIPAILHRIISDAWQHKREDRPTMKDICRRFDQFWNDNPDEASQAPSMLPSASPTPLDPVRRSSPTTLYSNAPTASSYEPSPSTLSVSPKPVTKPVVRMSEAYGRTPINSQNSFQDIPALAVPNTDHYSKPSPTIDPTHYSAFSNQQ